MSYGSAVTGSKSSDGSDSLVSRIKREPVQGIFQVIPAEAVTELLGRAGADFVIIDGEHGVFCPSSLERMVRAGAAAGVSVMYRAASSADDLSKALDTGVAGLVVPRVESAAEAQAVVQAVRFPPVGSRGLGPGRAAFYGLDMQQIRAQANERVLLVLMIETQKGMANLDAIAAVEGVDVIMVGPADLASSMNVNAGSAEHADAIQAIKTASLAAGRHAGIHCADHQDAAVRAQQGFSFLPISLDAALLYGGAVKILKGE